MLAWRLRIWVTLILVVLCVPLPTRVVSTWGVDEEGRINAFAYRTGWYVAQWPDAPAIRHGDDPMDVIKEQVDVAEARRANLPRFAVVLVLATLAVSSRVRRRERVGVERGAAVES